MEGDRLSAILAYSCGSAHTDDYLFPFVPELTKKACVMMNELETNRTTAMTEANPALACRPQVWLPRSSVHGRSGRHMLF